MYELGKPTPPGKKIVEPRLRATPPTCREKIEWILDRRVEKKVDEPMIRIWLFLQCDEPTLQACLPALKRDKLIFHLIRMQRLQASGQHRFENISDMLRTTITASGLRL